MNPLTPFVPSTEGYPITYVVGKRNSGKTFTAHALSQQHTHIQEWNVWSEDNVWTEISEYLVRCCASWEVIDEALTNFVGDRMRKDSEDLEPCGIILDLSPEELLNKWVKSNTFQFLLINQEAIRCAVIIVSTRVQKPILEESDVVVLKHATEKTIYQIYDQCLLTLNPLCNQLDRVTTMWDQDGQVVFSEEMTSSLVQKLKEVVRYTGEEKWKASLFYRLVREQVKNMYEGVVIRQEKDGETTLYSFTTPSLRTASSPEEEEQAAPSSSCVIG